MSTEHPKGLKIDSTNLRDMYSFTLGHNGDKYMCTAIGDGVAEFRRVRVAKSKIDGVRLPERISIQFFGTLIGK